MEAEIQTLVVGVRFSKVGKIYHFDASTVPDLRIGDSVIVETSRGWQLGEVAQLLGGDSPPEDGPLKAIDRRATPRDLMLRQTWYSREVEVVKACQARVRELRLHGVKVITAEYSFDGSRLSIMFSSESEDKVDLKSLRSDMQRAYAPSQVELRQIGPRDVAKILGGMGACGLETRCCSKFLTDFSSISIRMAKEQGISLTPSEITGMCGRLRCCLIYEYETYCECKKELPKKNKRVVTPDGEGKVVGLLPLQLKVMVDVVDIGVRQYEKDDIRLAEGGPAAAENQAEKGDGNGNGNGEAKNHPTTPLPPRPPQPGQAPNQPGRRKGKGRGRRGPQQQ
ncbi:MAG TPA: regulatory iron-sulfur-containing complex subunit RicT [Anaerolineaceae bacterium]|nr:regulatory iron-sulfur-containing complex subunit RicT [Anaerolineaceae bacterium]